MNTASTPFKTMGVIAIIAAGLIAAAIAHRPTQPLVWMVAYLVLVTGVVQYVLGAGQASLTARPLAMSTIWGQWVLLNLGHAGVIAGTLLSNFVILILGTVLYDLAMLWFAWCVRGGMPGLRRTGYWLLIVVMAASSFVGVALSQLSK
ncbi:hypothetical protein [Pusillimonas sp. ANT_WB101]|uniref:hypothetical protein n=1 Tax=Pusillimonas sp. ANT_WB101 TaxID=2597356 RepID=UPI0011EC11FD|nr:hypothetical protein [Pusillimonas sp. ANT_WB101]KAA0911075.1 hypothetical protein FQ179_04275 [Pusillimonas sp. ANT_WB101]